MKYFRECIVDEKEEYMTAREIGLKYGIALDSRLGPGPKVAALLKKYIEENNIDYSETYCSNDGRLSLIYPKSIYEKMVIDMDVHNDKKFEYEVLISYERNNISKTRCHSILKIVAKNQLEVKDIIYMGASKEFVDNIESDFIKGSVKVVNILSKREVS